MDKGLIFGEHYPRAGGGTYLHAVRLRAQRDWVTLCTGESATPLPGKFDASSRDACPRCRTHER